MKYILCCILFVSSICLIGPPSYKKDTIFAIEEDAELEVSDVDIESGQNRNSKTLRKKRKKRQDYRNKLEDWQNCSVSGNLISVSTFCLSLIHMPYKSHKEISFKISHNIR